ncbi:heparan-alpha-glucosaminide N-acetyltransferase domain-containing protein [Angustibacter sp. Root456]|uniref:heparan-alpha-glucosaminide N-acetyltransferase domain-containing protein n=1 Tax=Angustibacter sp. Root456 TaxID=1736539 RepID=UPI0012FA0D48|nr:heparan-alpha-glucosaminide N-acetyltransferase domain-containing protein [Angustibacter sp. Root456]
MTGRLRGVDVARAVALIGMMGTHLLPEYGAQGRLTPWFWFAAGRSSALFALLAGVGLALATGGSEPRLLPWRATATRIATRALLIAALGMALVRLDPPIAVILTNYGLLFVLGLPLLRLGSRTLLGLAAAWVLVVPLVSQAWRGHLPPGPGAQIGFADLADPASLLTRLALTGYYPVLTWLAYLMVGIAVGRLPLRRTGVAEALVAAGTTLAGAAWLVSQALLASGGWAQLVRSGPAQVVAPWLGLGRLQLRGLYGTTPTTTWWWQAVVSPHSGTPFDLAQTIGSALAVLGLALLVCRAVERRPGTAAAAANGALEALARTGSMTLTLYSVHVVAADTQQELAHRSTLLLAHVTVAVVVASAWLSVAKRGPLEQVVHTASALAARAVSRSAR